ncbi:MAG: RIP metalloprotease RseP [Syntrophaceticus sp.]
MIILLAILVLGFLIFVHELGHFMVAKMVGIHVHEFSIGFGPKLLGFQKSKETTMYSLRVLPLGGFVRMAGMDPEEEEHDNGFNSKPLKSRFAVISAGSIMNFFVAILLFIITFGLIGVPAASNTNVIGEVLPDSPAMVAGLKAGDRIVSINETPTQNWEEVAGSIRESGKSDLKLVVKRQEQMLSFTVTPRYDPQFEVYQIGIRQQVIWQKQGFITAIKLGLDQSFQFAKMVLVGLVGLIGGTISTNEVAGPVGITVAIGEAAAVGPGYLMIFTAILGINLALINLLPIPALDGSKLIFLLVEGLRGRPVDPEKENFINLIGFALLMVLFVLITYNDIARIITGG